MHPPPVAAHANTRSVIAQTEENQQHLLKDAQTEPFAALPAAHEPPFAQEQQPSPPKHNRKRARSVSFAPGPAEIAAKYRTDDGHPDHEGETARQKRRLKRPAYEHLTVAAIESLEKELGEDCKPSIVRLKRRAGLLPLRGPPASFLDWLTHAAADLGAAKDGAEEQKRVQQAASCQVSTEDARRGTEVRISRDINVGTANGMHNKFRLSRPKTANAFGRGGVGSGAQAPSSNNRPLRLGSLGGPPNAYAALTLKPSDVPSKGRPLRLGSLKGPSTRGGGKSAGASGSKRLGSLGGGPL
jgi:hypothetical protein